jgi:excisionase family DNA binding protein
MSMADDDILSVAQVAADFGVTPQTVRSWIASGKLKAARIGKSFHIVRRDVRAMLEDASAAGYPAGARVTLSGAVAGPYVVEKSLGGGRLVVRPETPA